MYVCGYDGYMIMLLGVVCYFVVMWQFDGIVVLIFQFVEEGLGGVCVMIVEKLFEWFLVDEVYGMYNLFSGQFGCVMLCKGVVMVGVLFFDIVVMGCGSYGVILYYVVDLLVVVLVLVGQFQIIFGCNLLVMEIGVLLVIQIYLGSVYNVVLGIVMLVGILCFFKFQICDLMQCCMCEICVGFVLGYGVEVEIIFCEIFEVLENDLVLFDEWVVVVGDILGFDVVQIEIVLQMGFEDFVDMLQLIFGVYGYVYYVGMVQLYNLGFVLDIGILLVGVLIYVWLIEWCMLLVV